MLKLTPPVLKEGSLYIYSIYLVSMLSITRWPPNRDCMLPSEVTKAISELSALLNVAWRIYVVPGLALY